MADENKPHFYVITYDIPVDRRRNKVATALEDHGRRVQYSVFEANLTSAQIAALRRRQIVRMAQEALDQGALLTAEDFAFRIFNCGLRTISRDLQALAEEDITVPLRSQQRDIGRAITLTECRRWSCI